MELKIRKQIIAVILNQNVYDITNYLLKILVRCFICKFDYICIFILNRNQ